MSLLPRTKLRRWLQILRSKKIFRQLFNCGYQAKRFALTLVKAAFPPVSLRSLSRHRHIVQCEKSEGTGHAIGANFARFFERRGELQVTFCVFALLDSLRLNRRSRRWQSHRW